MVIYGNEANVNINILDCILCIKVWFATKNQFLVSLFSKYNFIISAFCTNKKCIKNDIFCIKLVINFIFRLFYPNETSKNTYNTHRYNHTNYSLFNDSIPFNINIFAKPFLINKKLATFLLQVFYLVPVEPKPPTPLSVFVSSSVSQNSAFKKGAITSWAILSPSETVCSVRLWLCKATITSPL